MVETSQLSNTFPPTEQLKRGQFIMVINKLHEKKQMKYRNLSIIKILNEKRNLLFISANKLGLIFTPIPFQSSLFGSSKTPYPT